MKSVNKRSAFLRFLHEKNKTPRGNLSFISSLTLLLTLLFLFISSPLFSQEINPEKLAKYVDDYFKFNSPPSLLVSVSIGDTLTWSASRGYSDIENSVPATQKSLYRVASISKLITAIAVIQLVSKGKLKLDDDIRAYVPYFPKKKWPVTIRQLLNHTSGVRTYYKDEFDLTKRFNSTREAVLYIANDSLVSKPGTKYLYSTLSFNLIAAAIETVSGDTYEKYVQQNIFLPSGMTDSRFDIHDEIILNRARGYTRSVSRRLINAPLADLSIKHAGGGILSTADNLTKLGQAIINNKLISSAWLDTLLTVSDVNKTYGLGVTVFRRENELINFGHSGAGTGFAANLIIYPKSKLVSVYLMNIRDRNLSDLAKDIAKIILYDSLKTFPPFRLDDSLHIAYADAGISGAIKFLENLKSEHEFLLRDNSSYAVDFAKDLIIMKKVHHAISVFSLLRQIKPEDISITAELGKAYLADNNAGMALRFLKIAFDQNRDPELKKLISQAEKLSSQKK